MDVLPSPKYASGYLGSEAIFHGFFFKKVLLKISQKSETPVPESLSNKVAGSASSTLAQVFPVNFEKFSLTPFFFRIPQDGCFYWFKNSHHNFRVEGSLV